MFLEIRIRFEAHVQHQFGRKQIIECGRSEYRHQAESFVKQRFRLMAFEKLIA
jgi:hypothetical protein